MSFVIADCSYCKTKNIRFDNLGFNIVASTVWDVFAICSNCDSPTVFRMLQKASLPYAIHDSLVKARKLEDIKDLNLSLCFTITKTMIPPNKEIIPCPEHVPDNIKTVFDEATLCLANNCYTASGAMFRLCLDLTTKELLQVWLEQNTDLIIKPTQSQKDKLFNRIEFLIDNSVIPSDLREYAHHIRLDGNDAAHDGSTEKEEAEDLLDFSELFLKRIYTIKKQLLVAQERRIARRQK
jgi:hypothetical protein